MKRLAVLAAAVVALLGIGATVAPVAQAATCEGIKVRLSDRAGNEILNLCLLASVM